MKYLVNNIFFIFNHIKINKFMAGSLNKVMLIGNLGKDPESKK